MSQSATASLRSDIQAKPMRYKAFISYSHAADGTLAPSLQTALQRFAKRWNQIRAFRIFRDKTSLSVTPALWSMIENALEQSEYFILLASPAAAESPWVDRELEYWLTHRSAETVVIVLTEGDLVWDGVHKEFDHARSTALPARLLGAFSEEPLYLDLRWVKTETDVSMHHPQFRDSVAAVAATLHGCSKEDLIGTEVAEHRKTLRLAWSAVIGLLTLTIIALGAAYWARKEKNRADAQAVIATQQRNTAVARQLIAQSQLKLREEYDTALLLSIQAYRGFPTMETLTHLHYMLDSRREVGRILHGHKGKVIFVSITPDGSKVVSGDDRGTMIMRQLQGEQSPVSLQTVDRVEAMALHPSKEIVALAVNDEIVLWDLAKRQPIGEALKGHRGAVTSLAFDPEGKLLASGSWDNTAMLWDVASRSALHKPLKGHLDNSNPLEMAVGVNAVAFSPDGTLLATTGNDNRVLLWDVATGERYGKPLEGHKTRPGQLFPGVQAVAFGPSGTLLATGGRDHEIFLWDVKAQSPVGDPLQADSGVTALAFAGNERVLFSATEFGRIQAWSIADHSPIAEPLQGYPGKITCLAVDPSAPGLISGGENGKLIVWRPFRFSDRLARLLTHPEPDAVPVLNPNTGRRHFPDLLRRVTFSDGGELVASASDDGGVVVWDAKSGREIDRFTTHPAGIFALKFDPSAKRIAVAGYGDMVVVREIGSGRWKGLRGHGRAVGALAFSADGSMLAAGTASGSCKIWKLDPPELLGEWKLHERPVALVAFREKDHELISVDLDGKVKLWDVASRKLVRADDGRGESEGTFAISGNGNVLASCIHGGIALWDVAKWTPLGVGTIPVGESNQAGKGLALSADGSVVAFGQGTGITLYSTRSGERLLPALAVRASLDDVALSPEGKTLAAVGAEPDVYLWNLDVDSWVGRAFEVAGRILTEDEWQHYCPGQPYHPHPDR